MRRNVAGKRRFLKIIMAGMVIWLLALFITPLAAEPRSIRIEDGGANVIDTRDQWGSFAPTHQVVYGIGDFLCHQRPERSFFLSGNQMAVCARDVGIFVGVLIGTAIAFIARPDLPADEAIAELVRRVLKVPLRPRPLMVLLGVLFLAPIFMDGGLQLVTSYESTNATRALTGILGAGYLTLWAALFLEV